MLKIYKTNNGVLNELKTIEPNSWINVYEPTDKDIEKLSKSFNIEESELRSFLDEEEQSHIEVEDNYKLIVLDIPAIEKNENFNLRITIPLIIIIVEDDYIITMCNKKNSITQEFINNKVKNFYTDKKSRFTMQIIFKVASQYIRDLKKINEEVNESTKLLKKSTTNNNLIELMHLQKSLVYFSTSLRSNDVVLERIQKNPAIKLYDDDVDVLEEAMIENKQAIEMSTVYSSILTSTIEIFGNIISNNLNTIMKFLAGFTIVISIPTIVASFMGMNVPLGIFTTYKYSFIIVFIISIVISLIAAIILKRKNML